MIEVAVLSQGTSLAVSIGWWMQSESTEASKRWEEDSRLCTKRCTSLSCRLHYPGVQLPVVHSVCINWGEPVMVLSRWEKELGHDALATRSAVSTCYTFGIKKLCHIIVIIETSQLAGETYEDSDCTIVFTIVHQLKRIIVVQNRRSCQFADKWAERSYYDKSDVVLCVK